MAAKTAQDLINLMSTDAAFREAVQAATTREARKAIMTENGFGHLTADDVRALAKNQGAELSEADLEAVAGGRAVEWAGVLVAAAALAL